MPRCEFSGLGPVVENLVSHSNIKTKSKAFPNIQKRTFYSNILKRNFRARVTASAIRNVDKFGSVDIYILKQNNKKLSPRILRLKNQLLNHLGKKNEVKN